jgi:hypothetical protein
MTVFWIVIAAWNAVAIVLAFAGAFRPRLRSVFARVAGLQLWVASILGFGLMVLGSSCHLASLAGADLAAGGTGLFFGPFLWACGGVIPMIVMLLLSARSRRSRE